MSSSCCPGNFSSRSLGSCLRYSGSSCGSYPSNLVYTTDVCSPSTCQLGPSVYTGCGETICERPRCQSPCVVPISCQASCYRPRPSALCSPCRSPYTGSLGCGSSSGNFSSRSLGSCLSYSGSSCGSYPSNLVYTTDVCSPSTCQLGPSVYTGCGETICERPRCQSPCVVPISCQASCYRPRPSALCSPCRSPYTGSLGWGSSSSCSRGYGAGSCYTLTCGPSSFRPQACGASGFPSLTYGSGFCRPSCLTPLPCQAPCYRPAC